MELGENLQTGLSAQSHRLNFLLYRYFYYLSLIVLKFESIMARLWICLITLLLNLLTGVRGYMIDQDCGGSYRLPLPTVPQL